MGLNLGELYGTIGLDTGPLSAGFAKAKDMLAKWGESMKRKNEEDGKESGSKWTEGWKGAALVGAATAGIAVASVVAGAIVRGMNLEPARDKVQAELGLTEKQAEAVGKAAGAAYSNNFGESLESVTDATGIVISSIKGMKDASVEELQGMTEKVLTISDLFEIDVARAAQVAGQMVKSGFAGTADEALDLLTASLQKVPKNVREDIVDAVDEYGPFFNNIGIKGQDAMELLVKASEKGMYGIDKTGDAVKEFGIRATDMSKTSGVAFKQIGLDQEKMAAALLKGGDTGKEAFQKIIDGILSIKDPTEQSQAALALFGTPLEDLSVTEIPKFLKGLQTGTGALDNFKGSTQDAANVMGDNAQANLNAFVRKLEVFAVETIGNKVLPKINEWTGWFNENLAPALQTGVQNLQGFGEWIQKNTSWLLPLGTALLVVTGAVAALGAAQAVMAAGGFLSFIMNMVKSTQLWTAGQWLLNAAMSANPIGLIVIAIAALVAAFIVAYNSSEDFRNIVNGALEKVKEVALAVIGWFTGPFAKFWVDLWKTCVRNVTGFFEGVARIWNQLTGFVGDRVTSMGKGIQSGFNTARDWAVGALGGLSNGAKRIWDDLSSYQQRWNGAFGKLLKGDFGGFAKDVQGIWSDMTKGLSKVWDGFQKGVAKIWDLMPDDIKRPIRNAVNWINETFIGGVNGMLGKLNISWKIPQIPGFAGGGYTGAGGKYVPAGIVHAGEVVFSQEDVAAHGGVAAVERMRKARYQAGGEGLDGFSEGGAVGGGAGGLPAWQASVRAIARIVAKLFNVAVPYTGPQSRPQASRFGYVSDHPRGMAADFMFPQLHDPKGYAMNAWMHRNAGPIALKYTVWDGYSYPLGGGKRGPLNRGNATDNHYDHVHASFQDRVAPAALAGMAELGDLFGLGGLISGLLKKLNVPMPWDEVITTALKKTPEAIMKKIFGSFAMGTDYAPAGIASVAENGAELVLGKSLRAFRGGERVLTASQTSKALGSGVTPEDIRRALEGLRVDIANGRLFFDREMGRYESKLDFDSRLVGAGGGI